MTPEQRKLASIDLTLTYFQSYYTEWRLTKVLTIKKLIDDRYDFYRDIVDEINNGLDVVTDSIIAQEIKNGLYHDAIAQCIQYIEDLFALINAAKKPDLFVRNVITYGAGTITNLIKSYKANSKNISRDFYIPNVEFADSDSQQQIKEGVEYLVELVKDQVKFYEKYWFFYNQYKHGLSIPIRGYGNQYTDEQVELDKNGQMEPMIAAYDNMNIKAAQSKGTFNPSHGVMMPGFTENVRPFIPQLEKENNFLRLVFPPDVPDFDFDILIDQAYKTRACISTFIANYSRHIKPDVDMQRFQLPADYRNNQTIICEYKIEEG